LELVGLVLLPLLCRLARVAQLDLELLSERFERLLKPGALGLVLDDELPVPLVGLGEPIFQLPADSHGLIELGQHDRTFAVQLKQPSFALFQTRSELLLVGYFLRQVAYYRPMLVSQRFDGMLEASPLALELRGQPLLPPVRVADCRLEPLPLFCSLTDLRDRCVAFGIYLGQPRIALGKRSLHVLIVGLRLPGRVEISSELLIPRFGILKALLELPAVRHCLIEVRQRSRSCSIEPVQFDLALLKCPFPIRHRLGGSRQIYLDLSVASLELLMPRFQFTELALELLPPRQNLFELCQSRCAFRIDLLELLVALLEYGLNLVTLRRRSLRGCRQDGKRLREVGPRVAAAPCRFLPAALTPERDPNPCR
jgi:hypothetical protein